MLGERWRRERISEGYNHPLNLKLVKAWRKVPWTTRFWRGIGLLLCGVFTWGLVVHFRGGDMTVYLDICGVACLVYLSDHLYASIADFISRWRGGPQLLILGRPAQRSSLWFGVLLVLLGLHGQIGGVFSPTRSAPVAVWFILLGLDILYGGLRRGEVREKGIRLPGDGRFLPWNSIASWEWKDEDLELCLSRWIPGTRGRRCIVSIPEQYRAALTGILRAKIPRLASDSP